MAELNPKARAQIEQILTKGEQVSPQDVLDILANPIWVGIPPYPMLIDERIWIKAAVKLIKKEGAANFLRRMIRILRGSMEYIWNTREEETDEG